MKFLIPLLCLVLVACSGAGEPDPVQETEPPTNVDPAPMNPVPTIQARMIRVPMTRAPTSRLSTQSPSPLKLTCRTWTKQPHQSYLSVCKVTAL